ncbi:hypothetical protein M569_12007 [Genlisea aurea]|uniref:Uncharacterized protein n=1 Tax=Genlisea aurea TaxID=192259 RepID=S8DSI9_9LAMI|nr:hypothetical protein M569_12007 [Genlisea aurea]
MWERAAPPQILIIPNPTVFVLWRATFFQTFTSTSHFFPEAEERRCEANKSGAMGSPLYSPPVVGAITFVHDLDNVGRNDLHTLDEVDGFSLDSPAVPSGRALVGLRGKNRRQKCGKKVAKVAKSLGRLQLLCDVRCERLCVSNGNCPP